MYISFTYLVHNPQHNMQIKAMKLIMDKTYSKGATKLKMLIDPTNKVTQEGQILETHSTH